MALSDILASGSFFAVRDALDAIYAPFAATCHAEIVGRFMRWMSRADQKNRQILQLFSPEGGKTAEFYDGVRVYGNITIESAVNAVLERHSMPQEILAKGIRSTRLNLPPQVYTAIEAAYLPEWRAIGPKSALAACGIEGGDLDYMNRLYRASRRYEMAIGELRKALRETESCLVAPG